MRIYSMELKFANIKFLFVFKIIEFKELYYHVKINLELCSLSCIFANDKALKNF